MIPVVMEGVYWKEIPLGVLVLHFYCRWSYSKPMRSLLLEKFNVMNSVSYLVCFFYSYIVHMNVNE